MKDLIIKSNNVSFRETDEIHDRQPIFRAYCRQFPDQFNIQIRGFLPIEKDNRKKPTIAKNLIATICLSKDEILQLAELVKNPQP